MIVLPEPFHSFLDQRAIFFVLGMGLEAFGIAIQLMLGFPAYPLLDGIVAVAFAAGVWMYWRQFNAQPKTKTLTDRIK